MKNLCVYCSSSMPKDERLVQEALHFADVLVQKGWNMVYGGAQVGIMGIIAREVRSRGGKVIGVMPHLLTKREVLSFELDESYLVNDMYERKGMMIAKSQGFVAFPGGFGTLDELFDCLTQSTLGLHRHPVGLLNVCGYYDSLVEFLRHGMDTGLLNREFGESLQVADTPEKLLDMFESYVPPAIPDWVNL